MKLEKAQKLVQYRDVDGLSYRDMGKRLRCHHTTARKWYIQAKQVVADFRAAQATGDTPQPSTPTHQTPQNHQGESATGVDGPSTLGPNGDTGKREPGPNDVRVVDVDDKWKRITGNQQSQSSPGEPPAPAKPEQPAQGQAALHMSNGPTTIVGGLDSPGDDASLWERYSAPIPPPEAWERQEVRMLDAFGHRAVHKCPDFDEYAELAGGLIEATFLGARDVAMQDSDGVIRNYRISVQLPQEQKVELAKKFGVPFYRLARMIGTQGPLAELAVAGLSLFGTMKMVDAVLASSAAEQIIKSKQLIIDREEGEGGDDG